MEHFGPVKSVQVKFPHTNDPKFQAEKSLQAFVHFENSSDADKAIEKSRKFPDVVALFVKRVDIGPLLNRSKLSQFQKTQPPKK